MTTSELETRSEDIRLSCAFIPDIAKRADVLVLFAFLETLRDIPERTNEPLMGEIRLRWWYEALEEIRDGGPVRYHPLIEALQRLIPQYDLPVENLMAVVEAQMPLLDKTPLDLITALGAVDKGEGVVARLAASIIDPSADAAQLAGPSRFYGLAVLKRMRRLDDAGDAEGAHLKRDAERAAKALPASLMPLALPAALAESLWTAQASNPLTKRLKLVWAYLTGRL